MAQAEVKVIVLGDYGVGKTTFVKRSINGSLAKRFIKEHGCDVLPMLFTTNKCSLDFQVWDSQGQEALGGLKRQFFEGAQCAILMFDVTSKESYRHLEDWYQDVRNICFKAGKSRMPIVVCGNKADMEGRVVHPRHIVFPKKYGFPYFDVSARSNLNFESVFLALIRLYLNDSTVSFLSDALLKDPSVPIDHQKMALYRLEWEQFLCLPLPSGEDDDYTLIQGQSQHDLSVHASISMLGMSATDLSDKLQLAPRTNSPKLFSSETPLSIPQSMNLLSSQEHLSRNRHSHTQYGSGGQSDSSQLSSLASSPKLQSVKASGSVLRSSSQSPSITSQIPKIDTLILNREQHSSDIQSGNLKRVKKILAESAAEMIREGHSVLKQEAGDTADGYGIRVFSDSTLYAGDFLRGCREGVGTQRWCNGDSYHGYWLNDAPHGRGQYMFSNGDTYTGQWESGRVIDDGTFAHENGELFDGEHLKRSIQTLKLQIESSN